MILTKLDYNQLGSSSQIKQFDVSLTIFSVGNFPIEFPIHFTKASLEAKFTMQCESICG